MRMHSCIMYAYPLFFSYGVRGMVCLTGQFPFLSLIAKTPQFLIRHLRTCGMETDSRGGVGDVEVLEGS